MAHSKQAKKRLRQNAKKRLRQNAKENLQNRWIAGSMRTSTKKLLAAVAAGDKAAALKLKTETESHIDRAAKTNVIHKNAAARKKSQIAKAVQGMG